MAVEDFSFSYCENYSNHQAYIYLQQIWGHSPKQNTQVLEDDSKHNCIWAKTVDDLPHLPILSVQRRSHACDSGFNLYYLTVYILVTNFDPKPFT